MKTIKTFLMLSAIAFSFLCFSFAPVKAASPPTPPAAKAQKAKVPHVANVANFGTYEGAFFSPALTTPADLLKEKTIKYSCRLDSTGATKQPLRSGRYHSPPNLRRFTGYGLENNARGKISQS